MQNGGSRIAVGVDVHRVDRDALRLDVVALDALAGTAQAVGDWDRARETANERIRFEEKNPMYMKTTTATTSSAP